MKKLFEIEQKKKIIIINKFNPNKITIANFYKVIVYYGGVFVLITKEMLDSSYYDSFLKSFIITK